MAPTGRRTSNCGTERRPARWLAAAVGLALLVAACGADEEPELTLEDRLETLEGRALTAGEVADRLNTAEALCAMDDPILDAVWRRLSEDQLAFQDFTFAHVCPDRSIFYAGLTGRYVTEEAENSGVVTSTTPPIRTTATADSLGSGPVGTDPEPRAGTTATTDPDPGTDPDGSPPDPGATMEVTPTTEPTTPSTGPDATTPDR